MAQWKLTLYNNTLSSKSGNVVPCCPTLDAKRAFRNSLQVTVPPENLAIIDRNTFFNTDVQRLTVEFDEVANPLCYRSNYAIVEINIAGGGAMYYYYWIDNIQYMNSIDKTGNIAKNASMVAVLELSKDVWQSEFFREEYRKTVGWVLAMPKIKDFFCARTNHKRLLENSYVDGGGGANDDLPLAASSRFAVEKNLSPTYASYYIIYVATITQTNNDLSGALYNSGTYIYFTDGIQYSGSTSTNLNKALESIMRNNTSGKLRASTKLPPVYPANDVGNGNYYVSRAFLIPSSIFQSSLIYSNEYHFDITLILGNKERDATFRVVEPFIDLKHTILISPTVGITDPSQYSVIGGANGQIPISRKIYSARSYTDSKAMWGQGGAGALIYPVYGTNSSSITIQIKAVGDGFSATLETSNGDKIDITSAWSLSVRYNNAQEAASKQIEQQKTALILSTVLGLAGAAAGGGVGLLAFAGSAGNAIIQGQNIARQENDIKKLAPTSGGGDLINFWALKYPIYIKIYPWGRSGSNNAEPRASIFSSSGAALNAQVDPNIIFEPTDIANYAYFQGDCIITGMSADYVDYCTKKFASGVTFIYF